MFKAFFLLLIAQALIIQNISGTPIGALCNAPCASSFAPFSSLYGSYGFYSPANLAASNGGGLFVTSASPIEPIGVSVLSENIIEGALEVIGEVPFLGTIAFEGGLPTIGAGSVTYGCGNGAVAMVAEDYAGAYNGYASPYNYDVYGYNDYARCGNGAVAMVAEDYAGAYNGYASPYNYDVYGYNGYPRCGIMF